MTEMSVAHQFQTAGQQREAANLGMWIFIATEVLFFGVLFASYAISRLHYPEGFAEAGRHPDLLLGAIETIVLLTSSLSMALAVQSLKENAIQYAYALLSMTGVLGMVFIGIHITEYVQDYREGLLPAFNFHYEGSHAAQVALFYFLYYVMTGFHLLHVSIGVLLIAVITLRVKRRCFGPAYHTPVEMTALYWDFVDIVWLFLFPAFYLVSRG